MQEREPAVADQAIPLRGIFNAALDAVIVVGADGRVRDWNPSAERIFGYRLDEVVGEELAELIIPGPLRDAHRHALERYLQTGEPTIIGRRVEVSGQRRDGTEFPVELAISRIDGSDPALFVGFLRDLGSLDATARENARLQQRMAFLAQAGLVLETSLDVDETLHRLAELTVPELAELTVIDLLEDGESIRLTVAAASEPDAAARIEELRRREPLRLSGPHPVAEVLRTGKPALIESMSPEFHRHIAQGPAHLGLMRDLEYRSAVVVPLVARKRVLGALSLLRMRNAEPFHRDDLVLTEELARRAALAVDNARLFESTRDLARTLQQSLLPGQMPAVPGVRLTTRYRAAEQGQDVGGDFYDVFGIGDRRWGIVIGDVCGKGADAAALTSLARYTIRALAEADPAIVLQRLGEALMRDPGPAPGRFLTALFGIAAWEDERFVIDVASAGHPRPLVRRQSGEVAPVVVGGPLIGIHHSDEYRAERVELAPGDSLLLYTDGLTDARAPAAILTEGDVAQLLERAEELRGAELAEFLEQAVTAGQESRDDIAVLIIELLTESEAPAGASRISSARAS